MSTVSTQGRIRDALDRNVRALELRPSLGAKVATTRVELTEGLICHSTEGDWRLSSDMSEKMGGTSTAPNPGTIGRTALGTCLATSFAMWAARMDVSFERIAVDVIAEFDARGEMGVSDEVPPGYTKVTFKVHVVSQAPEERVRELFAVTERHTSWLDLIRRPVDTAIELTIAPG